MRLDGFIVNGSKKSKDFHPSFSKDYEKDEGEEILESFKIQLGEL